MLNALNINHCCTYRWHALLLTLAKQRIFPKGKLASNIGLPLTARKARFPDYDKLFAQISNAVKNTPNTIMIPYGSHTVMPNSESTLVTKFIPIL